MINTTKGKLPYRLVQVKNANSSNKVETDRINIVFNQWVEGMKKAGTNKVTRRIVAMNTLLMLNNRSLKDIYDFSKISDSTIKAMHQYQKHYKEMNKTDNYSKADCIFGYRTVQQLMYNAKIKIISGTKLDSNFDNKTNKNAINIDEQEGYYRKNFVIN